MKTLNLANTALETNQLGRGWKSPLEADDGTGDFVAVSDDDNLKCCMLDLLSTRVGERVMNEDIGVSFSDQLFEDPEGAMEVLPVQAIDCLTRYEPRIYEVRADASYSEEDGFGGVVYVAITYRKRTTGRRDNLVWPVYMNPAGGGVPIDGR